MFAKGPRFLPEKPSDVPGPGYYKPQEESRSEAYKKGAFLEKAERFSSENGSVIPGPKESNPRSGPSKSQKSDQTLTYLQHQIQELKASNTRMLTEHQHTIKKYEEKVTHNESTVKSLVKDNVALQAQLTAKEREQRSSCQREAALRIALEKAECNSKSEVERADKLARLQRKLHDLEKMQCDDKKRHQAEVEQMKCELDACRKTAIEQTERVALHQKQQEISESKMRDLKKAIIADQAEIRELRTKIKGAEQLGYRVTSHQADVKQLKETLRNLESQHKAELQARDSKLVQQEKALELERGHKKALEQQIESIKSKAELEVKEAEAHEDCLQRELDTLRRTTEEERFSAAEARQRCTDIQATMVSVAQSYGHLAASSVPLTRHQQSETLCTSLHLRNIRLERRLADRDALVEQLTEYCRQVSGQNTLLTRLLQDAEDDRRVLLRRRHFDDASTVGDDTILHSLLDAQNWAAQHRECLLQTDLQLAQVLGCFYRAQCDNLLVAYALANRETVEQSHITDRLINDYSELQGEAETLRQIYNTAEAELSSKALQAAEALTREQTLNERVVGRQREIEGLTDALRKEREANRRLAQASQQSQMNEERLRSELDELGDEIADLTRYKAAHAELLSEVVELIRRNELAEAEADRLGKFNAEILSHTNPQQKIFYVDRIRRELADTKHQLLKSTRDCEDLAADNAALYHEVSAYKPIVVPIDQTRGTRVRIERQPLVPRHVNGLAESLSVDIRPSTPDASIDASPMTLDEIT